MSMLTHEAGEQGEHTLKRSLGAVNLVTLGIGAVIGAGIFVLTGQAAALYAGPAVALSFVLAGITCAFAGLCYSEFASIIPIAGSAYTYGYATLGELVAWIIGWDLVLEYAFGASTVASGWSGYFNSLLQQFGIFIPPQLTASTGTHLVFYQHQWMPVMSLPPGVSDAGLPHVTAAFNLIAMAIVMVITVILVIGIKESANFNSAIVFIKLTVVAIFLVVGGYFLIRHPQVAKMNWHPFIPPRDAHGNFGWGGISKGASRIFFAYIGFDAVSTAAQEAKKPQRDMPIGILGSLAICTFLYILVSLVLTGLVSYKTLNVGAPVALGIDATGVSWGSLLVKIGAVFGLATVMLVMLLGQTRVFYSMSKDGLLVEVGLGGASEVPHAVDHDDRVWDLCGRVSRVPAHRQARRPGEHRHAAGVHDRVRGSVGAARAASRAASAVQDAAGAAGADPGNRVGDLPDVAVGGDHMGGDDRLADLRVDHLLHVFREAQQGAEAGQGAGGGLSGLGHSLQTPID